MQIRFDLLLKCNLTFGHGYSSGVHTPQFRKLLDKSSFYHSVYNFVTCVIVTNHFFFFKLKIFPCLKSKIEKAIWERGWREEVEKKRKEKKEQKGKNK